MHPYKFDLVYKMYNNNFDKYNGEREIIIIRLDIRVENRDKA
jgi:hypothetical protein